MSKPLDGRIALVTGASRGIGRALALELARRGAHIVALARTSGGLEELDDAVKAVGASATLVPLDLKDFDALDRLGLTLHQRYGRLDILLANGAILGPLSPIGHIDPKVFEEVIAVNVTANWRLIRALDPLLKMSDAGRLIALSSGAAFNVRAYWGLYGASKAALEVLCRAYADEVRNISPIKVMLVNPGRTRTRMRAEAAPGEDPLTLPPPEEIAPMIADLASPAWAETGMLYDVPSRAVLTFRPPG